MTIYDALSLYFLVFWVYFWISIFLSQGTDILIIWANAIFWPLKFIFFLAKAFAYVVTSDRKWLS